MITKEEIKKLLEKPLGEIYRYPQGSANGPSAALIQIWYEIFRNNTYEQLRTGMMKFIADDKSEYQTFPSPGRVKPYVDRTPRDISQILEAAGIDADAWEKAGKDE